MATIGFANVTFAYSSRSMFPLINILLNRSCFVLLQMSVLVKSFGFAVSSDCGRFLGPVVNGKRRRARPEEMTNFCVLRFLVLSRGSHYRGNLGTCGRHVTAFVTVS